MEQEVAACLGYPPYSQRSGNDCMELKHSTFGSINTFRICLTSTKFKFYCGKMPTGKLLAIKIPSKFGLAIVADLCNLFNH